ncbi:MAG: response regulator, partial [Desulfobacterales bacterium]|nr:response regulator [Desulfobacterales bacterium]
EAKEQKTELARGTGTILVVQGQEGVMNTTRAILERLGYCVLGANSGMEAINIAKTFDGDIDLAILDIQLPDMRGKSAYTFIKDARPNLKVIVCSML